MRLPIYCLMIGCIAKWNLLVCQSPIGVSYTQQNITISQNFDGLSATGSFSIIGKGPHLLQNAPITAANTNGWQFLQISGSGTSANFYVGTGSSTGSGIYSYGLSNNAERAIGSLASSTGIYTMGIILTNNTGTTLNTASISFIAEQWRKGGSGNKNTWRFRYKTGSLNDINQSSLVDEAQLNFSSLQTSTGVATLNGNLPENQMAASFTLENIQWNNGEQILLRWDDADETGSDDAMAIDQFSFSAKYKAPNPVSLNDIQSLADNPTNADTIKYAIKFGGNITGLNIANFQLKSFGLTNTKLVKIDGAGSDYTATVFTGNGEGFFQLGIINDNNIIPGIQQLPYFDIDSQWVDKVGPVITKISLPNSLMKSGDTIPIYINIKKEKNTCTIFQGLINNYPLLSFKKITDTTYSAIIIIPSTGTDVKASDHIPIAVILLDSLGNKSELYSEAIQQSNDAIDFNKPIQLSFSSSSDTLLKSGDTLKLIIQFNEQVVLDVNSPTNYIPITIGSRVKNIGYFSGNNTESIIFQYIIQPGEIDKDGIKISSSFVAKNLVIKDLAGNVGTISLLSSSIQKIKIDGIAPEFTISKDSTIVLCESNKKYILDEVLKANNKEQDELLTWKVQQPFTKLSITKSIHQQSSSSSTIVPKDFIIENTNSFSGIDSCTFSLSDGINIVLKKIYFNIQSALSNNQISAAQEICAGSIPSLFNGSLKSIKDSIAVYLWEFSNLSDTTGFINATGKNNDPNYQSSAISKNTWFRRKIINGPCNSISNSLYISITTNIIWNGKSNADWNNPSNWCNNKIPTDSVDITIPANYVNSPSILTSATVKKLLLSNGAKLTITGKLFINDQLTGDSASINAINGTVVFSGKIPQTINSKVFETSTIEQLLIDNISGVTIITPLTIIKSIGISKGQLITNNLLTLKYKSLISALASGTSIRGNVNVENNFAANTKGNYLVGHPFSEPILINQITKQPIAYYPNALANKDSFGISYNWNTFLLNNNTEENKWQKYQGIKIKLESSNDSSISSPIFKGPLNTGLQEIKLFKNAFNGFNVVGNPFVSPINLRSITKGRMIGNHYWIWNPKLGLNGGFITIPATQSYIINPFEVLIAESRANTENEILIAEESKITNWNTEIFPTFKEEWNYFIDISLFANNIYSDQLVLIDNAISKNNFDSTDASKLQNPDINLYSMSSDQQKLSVDSRRLNTNTIIPIMVETKTNGSFYFKINQANLPSDNVLVLHDRYTNSYLPLLKDSIYSFNLSSDSLSKSSGRFEISRLIPSGDINQLINLLTIKTYPNPVNNELTVGIKSSTLNNTTINIISSSGSLVKSINAGNIQQKIIKIPVNDLTNGIYILQVICGANQRSIQFIKQ